jgi:hypothetical protein
MGGAPPGCLLPAKEVERLPAIPADSLAHLAATGVVGIAVTGALFAACFSLVAPPATVRQAAFVSITTGSSLELARTTAAVSPAAATVSPAMSPAMAPAPSAPPRVSSVPATARAAAAALSTGDIARAIARGDAFFRNGDLAMARFFFQLAADAGDRQAALQLGATFDPASLTRWPGRGDPTAARYWYGRAIALGAKDAASRLARLDAATSR